MAGQHPSHSAPFWSSPYTNPELEYVYLGSPQTSQSSQGSPRPQQPPMLQPGPMLQPDFFASNSHHNLQPRNVYGDCNPLGLAVAGAMPTVPSSQPTFLPVPEINIQVPSLPQGFAPTYAQKPSQAQAQSQSQSLYPFGSESTQFEDIWSSLDSDLLDSVTPEDISMVEAYAPPGFDRSRLAAQPHPDYNSWAMNPPPLAPAVAEEAQSSNRAGAFAESSNRAFAVSHQFGNVVANQPGFGPGVAAGSAQEYGRVGTDSRWELMDVLMGDTHSESVSSTSPAAEPVHSNAQVPFGYNNPSDGSHSHRKSDHGNRKRSNGNAGSGNVVNAGNLGSGGNVGNFANLGSGGHVGNVANLGNVGNLGSGGNVGNVGRNLGNVGNLGSGGNVGNVGRNLGNVGNLGSGVNVGNIANLGNVGRNLGNVGNLGSGGNVGNVGNLGSGGNVGNVANLGNVGPSLGNVANLGNIGDPLARSLRPDSTSRTATPVLSNAQVPFGYGNPGNGSLSHGTSDHGYANRGSGYAGNATLGNTGNLGNVGDPLARSSYPDRNFREQTQSNAMGGYQEVKAVENDYAGAMLAPIRTLGEPRWAEQLLNLCAAAIASKNISRTQHLMWVLNDLASVVGDANQRFAAYGLRALFCRITGRMEAAATFLRPRHHDQEVSFGPKTVHRALVKFHEYVPWHQNCYSVASQTLLEVCAGKSRLHLIDIGAGKGIEWPIFIDALVSRSGGPPSILRMTMIRDVRREELNINTAKSVNSEAADFMTRLVKFASLLGLHVEVNMVQKPLECVTREDLKIREGEILAVVCQFRLHRLTEEPPARFSNATPPRLSPRDEFLQFLYSLQPDVFIQSDNNSDHCSHDFLTRFQNCVNFWWLCYESMDVGYAGRDPVERQILEYEGSMMLLNTVACEGIARIERNEGHETWQRRITRAGFVARDISEETKKASQNLVANHSDFWDVAFVGTNTVSLQWRKQPTTFTSVWKTASSCSKPSCKCSMLHS